MNKAKFAKSMYTFLLSRDPYPQEDGIASHYYMIKNNKNNEAKGTKKRNGDINLKKAKKERRKERSEDVIYAI